jgi:uncharacterized protein YbbC (DUF1343 family)
MGRKSNSIVLMFCLWVFTGLGQKTLIPGAAQFPAYLPALKGKQVALVVNHTSVVGKTHLADTLLSLGVSVKKIFAPEHGFRGTADAGAHIDNEVDRKTGLALISLYGKHKKPTAEDLQGIDVVLFDIQDVGARFYTYSSTLHYVLEACAENKVPLTVLDRPNPNGHYVDGPVLEKAQASFVGLNPIPVVHGCTLGELARMINGEGWLVNRVKASLNVIPVANYTHASPVHVAIAPSPNLPNDQSIALYPSLCLFEGTNVSIGRGTNLQFQVVGTNIAGLGDYTFTPVPKPGAMDPPLKDQKCYGYNLSNLRARNLGFSLKYLLYFYSKSGLGEKFFTSPSFFDKLAGTDQLRLAIIAGKTEKDIRDSWEPGLVQYRKMRQNYLLYR